MWECGTFLWWVLPSCSFLQPFRRPAWSRWVHLFHFISSQSKYDANCWNDYFPIYFATLSVVQSSLVFEHRMKTLEFVGLFYQKYVTFHLLYCISFCNTGLQFRVAEISSFSKAFSSVQFTSLLFSQNIIQYKNTSRNCKVARERRRNQKAYEAWAPQSQRNKQNKMKFLGVIR